MTGSLCYELLMAGPGRTVPKLNLILVYYTELSGIFFSVKIKSLDKTAD